MKNVIIAIATNRPIASDTQRCLSELMQAGAKKLTSEGSSDVAYARNVTLSFVVREFEKNPELNVALLIDDDMLFNLAQAVELCTHALAHGCAASAVYSTAISEIAATTRWAPEGKWLAGLGFLAIPRQALLELAELSPSFEMRGHKIWEFTRSALHVVDGHSRWYGEDYWLCARLGGVDVLPIAVGHLKTVPLVPDEETLRRVRERLPFEAAGARGLPFLVRTGQGTGLSVDQKTREPADPDVSDYDAALGVNKGQ